MVRRAWAGERFTTLDDAERSLGEGDLLITDHDGERAIAIAGVMGGAETEVGATTRNVLIEAGSTDAVSIARTARAHKLPSEASRRFERGVDPALAAAAAQPAVDLLVEHGGGVADPEVTDVGSPAGTGPRDDARRLPVQDRRDRLPRERGRVDPVVHRLFGDSGGSPADGHPADVAP